MTITLYGIPNCDIVKRARAWFSEQGLALTFHDFKKAGVPPAHLDAWIASAGWELVLNRKGSTWRQLGDAAQVAVIDAASARGLMLEHTSAIKRPVVEWPDGRITVGFDADEFASHH